MATGPPTSPSGLSFRARGDWAINRLLLITFCLLLTACGRAEQAPVCEDPLGCVIVEPDEPIHIAYLLTLDGDTAFLGQDSLGGIELALAERGRRLLGHAIRLSGADGGCSAEDGEAAAATLAADASLVGVIGPNCSATARAAMPAISETGLVMISPSNTAPDLTQQDGAWLPGYFRTVQSDLLQARVAADFAFTVLNARTAATIYDRQSYTIALQQAFADRFQALGGAVTFTGLIDTEESLLTNLTLIAADSADVLYLPLFEAEGAWVVQRAAEVSGLEETVLIGADSLFVDSFPENVGDAANGVYLTAPTVTGAAYDAFLARWLAAYGEPPPSLFHAFAYDATNLLLNAIEAVAEPLGEGGYRIGRAALRDALAATANYEGLTGRLTCTQMGDCASGAALGVYQIGEAEITEGNWPPPVVWSP